MQTFEVGETIYHVRVSPESGDFYVSQVIVTKVNTTMKYANVPSMYVKSRTYENEISLKDANIIPNNYNCHRIFKSKAVAQEYVTHPELWRPKGISPEDWKDGGKENYLGWH